MDTLKLGTRGSQLALFQAHSVATLLQSRDVRCEIVVITTSADRFADAALSEIGGKRLFVKEIEDALLRGDIDLAVHSSKDLPADLPEGLRLGAVLPREDPRDAVVLPAGAAASSVSDLVRQVGSGAIGTSSVRREAQLRAVFTEARFLPIRGNLGTRLQKLDEGGRFDALVLAAAGLRRLNHGGRISTTLPVETCVPAPGQGIIALEVRADDSRVSSLIGFVDDEPAAAALTAERAVVRHLGGGCQMPIGAYAFVEDQRLEITAAVLSLDGARVARTRASGGSSEAQSVGTAAAEQLLALGAHEILAEVRGAQTSSGPSQ